jgi:small subunit ribosomal protein S11
MLFFRRFKKRFISLKVTMRRTHSNVFVTIAGRKNRVFKVFSAGLLGFRNTKKDTPYAAEAVGKAAARYILGCHIRGTVAVIFLSPLDGRLRAVLRGLGFLGKLIKFSHVKSKFSPAHNGCRAKKTRRA